MINAQCVKRLTGFIFAQFWKFSNLFVVLLNVTANYLFQIIHVCLFLVCLNLSGLDSLF